MIQNYSPERTAKTTTGRVAPRLAGSWCRDRLELAAVDGEEGAGSRGDGSHQARGLGEKLFGVEPRENELLLGVLGVPAPGESGLGHEPAPDDQAPDPHEGRGAGEHRVGIGLAGLQHPPGDLLQSVDALLEVL